MAAGCDRRCTFRVSTGSSAGAVFELKDRRMRGEVEDGIGPLDGRTPQEGPLGSTRRARARSRASMA